MFLHRMDGTIADVNQATQKEYGYTRDELLSMSVEDIDPDYPEREKKGKFWEDLRKKAPLTFEARHVDKSGRIFPVEISISFVSIDNEEHVLAIARDLTEKKIAEEEHARLKEELFQAQKIEAIGKLAGGIAHDFNNILCSVKGNTELLIEDSEKGSSLYEDLCSINNSIDAGASLVKQLLMFSRKDPVEFEFFNVNGLLEDMHKMLRRLIGEDIRIESYLGAEPDIIKADKSSFNQIILNLVVNARDAMPSGGTIQVKTENMKLQGETVSRNPESRPGDFICLSVKDNGKGMSSEEIVRIFEPFYTTKGRGRGTGLGLAVSYFIITENHKGRIQVASSPGQGSSFTISLPV